LFYFFIYCCQHHERKTSCLDIFLLSDRQWGTEHQYLPQLFSWHLHITITYNLLHLRLWYVDVVTVIAQTPEVVCLTFQTSWHEKDGMWSELTWFETTVLHPTTDIFIYLLIILPLGGHIDIQIETKLAVLLGPYIQ
jgi:hypothetical protein